MELLDDPDADRGVDANVVDVVDVVDVYEPDPCSDDAHLKELSRPTNPRAWLGGGCCGCGGA